MPIVFGVAIGGALGASARYGLDRLIEADELAVPLGHVHDQRERVLPDRHHHGDTRREAASSPWLRVGLVVGVVGGYTTFSTFAQETLDLAELHHVALGFAYVVASVTFGLAAVYAGTLADARSSPSPCLRRQSVSATTCRKGVRHFCSSRCRGRLRLVGHDLPGRCQTPHPVKALDTRLVGKVSDTFACQGAADSQVFVGHDVPRRCQTLLPVKVSDTLLAKVSNAVP